MSFRDPRMYLTSESSEHLNLSGKRGHSKGRDSIGIGLLMEPAKDVLRRKSHSSRSEPPPMNVWLKEEDEPELFRLLNDRSSKLYRLFSQHYPKKTPQQCFLDLKYASPTDGEAQALYENVLKYVQLHRKLAKKKSRHNEKSKDNNGNAQPGAEKQRVQKTLPKEERKEIKEIKSVPFAQFVQADGHVDWKEEKANDRCNGLSGGQMGCGGITEENNPVCTSEGISAKLHIRACDDEEVSDGAMLQSYKTALDTANVDPGRRLALLDEDFNRIGRAGDGALASLLRAGPVSPNGNCYIKPSMRGNRIQRSLSSVSSIEVHKGKTHTTCSVSSSTSISISTCEIENNTVRNILNKIYTLESQKKRCRSNSEMRDVSSIRKKQRGLLVEFQKERERQKRKLIQAHQRDSCYDSGGGSARGGLAGGGVMDQISRNSSQYESCSKTPANTNMDMCALSSSLAQNCIALKNFEKDNGTSIEELLKLRESDLQSRKKRAQELLRWHQRIASEEASVKRMEALLRDTQSECDTGRKGNRSGECQEGKASGCSCNVCCPPKCCDPCSCQPKCCDPCKCIPKCCDPCACKPKCCDPCACKPKCCDSCACDPCACKPKCCDPCACKPKCCDSCACDPCACKPKCCDPCACKPKCCDSCACDPCACKPKCCDSCACDPCACPCSCTAKCCTSNGGGSPRDKKGHCKKTTRIVAENPPLCCSENCPGCENCPKTYCISGRTLNKIWKDISGLCCDKYNNCFEYNLTDEDFAELYASAKRERKIMRMGLDECGRCPNFDKEKEKEKKKHFAFKDTDRMGQSFGCSKTACEKDEEWLMMFKEPRHFELEQAPVAQEGSPTNGRSCISLEGVEEEEKAVSYAHKLEFKMEQIKIGGQEEGSDRRIKNVTAARRLFDVFREHQGIHEIQKELAGIKNISEEEKLSGDDAEEVVIEEPEDEILFERPAEEMDLQNSFEDVDLIVEKGVQANGRSIGEESALKNSPDPLPIIPENEPLMNSASIPTAGDLNPLPPLQLTATQETFLCPPPTIIASKEEVVEILDLSTSNRRPGAHILPNIEQQQQPVLRNLPPVPLSYIIKEVPRPEKVLAVLEEVQREGLAKQSVINLDETNPYVRTLLLEIPHLIKTVSENPEFGDTTQMALENSLIDRLEQLRAYQLNLKRAHMGIAELVFEGPHYPHVQKIQDLIEYPQVEEAYYSSCSPPRDGLMGSRGPTANPGWSPPYQESGYQRMEEDVEHPNEDGVELKRRYGAIQSEMEMRKDRSSEDETYFDEEDEFLDYYSDMQYLKQSENQIVAIFTDHVLNSMLDDVMLIIQRLFPGHTDCS